MLRTQCCRQPSLHYLSIKLNNLIRKHQILAFLIVPSEFSLKNLAVVFLIIFYFVIASSPTDGETFIDDEMDSTYAKYDN